MPFVKNKSKTICYLGDLIIEPGKKVLLTHEQAKALQEAGYFGAEGDLNDKADLEDDVGNPYPKHKAHALDPAALNPLPLRVQQVPANPQNPHGLSQPDLKLASDLAAKVEALAAQLQKQADEKAAQEKEIADLKNQLKTKANVASVGQLKKQVNGRKPHKKKPSGKE